MLDVADDPLSRAFVLQTSVSPRGSDRMTNRHSQHWGRHAVTGKQGPGLFESLMWVSGYHLAQTLAGLLLILLLLVAAFNGLPSRSSDIGAFATQLSQAELDWLLTALIGCATLGSLFFILPIAFWRLSPRPRNALGLHPPKWNQLLLLAGAVVPLGILSDELYQAASLLVLHLQQLAVNHWPLLAMFEIPDDTIGMIHGQTGRTAYPQLLVIVGVGPAIGEEIIFRGVIGRGLTARWGVVRGVLLTSLLFAIAHVSPSHALATIPIGIFLHVTYLATGSLWAPILVHFLNNALSVTLMKYELGQHVEVSMMLLLSSAVYVTAIAVLLLRGDGLMPSRPRKGIDSPVSVTSRISVTPNWLVLLASTGVLCFTFSFVAAAMAGPTL